MKKYLAVLLCIILCAGSAFAADDTKYSRDIAEAVRSFLADDGWKFDFDDERGIFKFATKINGKMKSVNYYIMIHNDAYTSYAISPMKADQEDADVVKNLNEFINRANYGLRNGNFEVDMRDGEIRYKVYVNCSGMIPSREVVKDSIIIPALMFERYSPGILGVLFSGTSAAEAIRQCEN